MEVPVPFMRRYNHRLYHAFRIMAKEPNMITGHAAYILKEDIEYFPALSGFSDIWDRWKNRMIPVWIQAGLGNPAGQSPDVWIRGYLVFLQVKNGRWLNPLKHIGRPLGFYGWVEWEDGEKLESITLNFDLKGNKKILAFMPFVEPPGAIRSKTWELGPVFL